MLILAIDMGMCYSVFCEFDTTTQAACFGRLRTRSEEVRRLFLKRRPTQVVVESGPLAAMVHDVVSAAGGLVLVADTSQDAWRWRNVKRKTDRDDAFKLARLAALGQINAVHIPSQEVRQWRGLIELRQGLVGERTRCKCRIRDLLRRHAEVTLERGGNGWSASEREQIGGWCKPLSECGPLELWRGVLAVQFERLRQLEAHVVEVESQLDRIGRSDPRVRGLQTLPGVGPRVAEVLVATLDQPQRFGRGRQVGAYAGLTPRQYDSGQTQRSGRISKRGNRTLRHMLNQAAWRAVQCDARFREAFTRVCRGSRKRRKIAIVAVMRKLLIVAWAMLRDGTRYGPPPRPRRQAATAATATVAA